MATLKLEIVTPEARAYSDDVDMVVLPGAGGRDGDLPHARADGDADQAGRAGGDQGRARCSTSRSGEGFVEITQTRVNVLTDMAIEAQQIDVHAAEEAVKRAEARLREGDLGGEEVAAVQAALQKSLAQLHVKRRRHS